MRVLLIYPRYHAHVVMEAYGELPQVLKPDDVRFMASNGVIGPPRLRIEGDTAAVVLSPTGSITDVKATLAHELAHVKHFESVPPPPGSLGSRALALPMEAYAEELVMREAPDVAVKRLEIGEKVLVDPHPVRGLLQDLERSLVLEPLRIAAERTGSGLNVPIVGAIHPEVEEVKKRLVREARRTDPLDPFSLREYVVKAREEIRRLLVP